MRTIDWVSVWTNGAVETLMIDLLLFAVVAGLAHALQLAEPEFPFIAAMRHDVIGDCCRRDHTMASAGGAERLKRQL
jgi:hypothetical protein